MAFDLTSLTKYVEQNKLDIIRKVVMSTKAQDLFNLQTGIKGDTAINILETTPTLQDGTTCGFSADGTSKFSQRLIKPAKIKVNMSWCERDLENYYMNFMCKIGVGNEALTFEQFITDSIIEKINVQKENLLCKGNKTSGNLIDGLVTIAKTSDGFISNSETTQTITTTKALIEKVYSEIPVEILNDKDTVIICGSDIYRQYVAELMPYNYFNYKTDITPDMELVIPGTNTRLIALNGLNGTNEVLGLNTRNVYVGVDLQNDSETFDMWYSKDDDMFKFNCRFELGLQVAFPDQVVFEKLKTE